MYIPTEAPSLLVSAPMAVAAGLMGAFAVMKRMTLAADAISHVALPGIGAALLFRINPMLGALAMLAAGAILIWALQTRARIATESVIGVVFTVSLAVGSFLTPGEELIDALFGQQSALGPWEAAFGLAGATAVIVFVLKSKNALIVSLVSREIASTAGISVARLDLFYLMAFALTVALGLRYLGVLLMGALIIIPASTARRFAATLDTMLALSAALATAAMLSGMLLGFYFGVETGPLIASVAGAIFVFSLILPRKV